MNCDLLHHVEQLVGIGRPPVSFVVNFGEQAFSLDDAFIEHGFRDPLVDDAGNDFALLGP